MVKLQVSEGDGSRSPGERLAFPGERKRKKVVLRPGGLVGARPSGTLGAGHATPRLVEEAERTLAPEPSLDLSTPPSASREEVGQAMSPVSGRPSKRWLWQQWVMERAPPPRPPALPGLAQGSLLPLLRGLGCCPPLSASHQGLWDLNV